MFISEKKTSLDILDKSLTQALSSGVRINHLFPTQPSNELRFITSYLDTSGVNNDARGI